MSRMEQPESTNPEFNRDITRHFVGRERETQIVLDVIDLVTNPPLMEENP